MKALAQTLYDFQELSQRLAKLDMGWQPTPLLPVRLTTQSNQLELSELQQALAKYTNSNGWLLQPSQLLKLPAALADLTAQPPLSAEGVTEYLTWQLTYLGQQRWLLVEHQVIPCSPAEATHLASEIVHQAVEPALRDIRYLRLWQLAEDLTQAPQLELAVFTGFHGTQK